MASDLVKINEKDFLSSSKLDPDDLDFDPSTYIMLHSFQIGVPCLSFDTLEDQLGSNREEFPLTSYLVSGTQTSKVSKNFIGVIKVSNLTKTQKDSKDEDSSDDESESEDESTQACFKMAEICCNSSINRIRATKINNDVSDVIATWSSTGSVDIWSIEEQLECLGDSGKMNAYIQNKVKSNTQPLFSFRGHMSEGYALDWSTRVKGNLASGCCKANIHLWSMTESGSWNVNQKPYASHTDSVEDIQWSPSEDTVFASCSVDKSIRIWDSRVCPSSGSMLSVEDAHTSDVNVLNWNHLEPFLASGSDDGFIKVWDLRELSTSKSIAELKYHNSPITSIEWNPNDSTVFAASSEDNKLTFWDLSVEKDDLETGDVKDEGSEENIPPYILFIHQGQKDIKECHWHKQLPGVMMSTSLSGFDVFRTISV